MKKLLILISLVSLLSLTACQAEETTFEPTPTPAPTSSTDNEQDDDKDTEEDVNDDKKEEPDTNEGDDSTEVDSTYGGTFTAIEGDLEFIKAFVGNEIDENYVNQIDMASSASQMGVIASETSAKWEIEINYIYSVLMKATNQSEAESEEQTAWANDLPIVIAEIKEKEASNGSSGTLDAQTSIMEVYRNRAIDLYAKVFSYTGTVEFAPTDGEVAG